MDVPVRRSAFARSCDFTNRIVAMCVTGKKTNYLISLKGSLLSNGMVDFIYELKFMVVYNTRVSMGSEPSGIRKNVLFHILKIDSDVGLHQHIEDKNKNAFLNYFETDVCYPQIDFGPLVYVVDDFHSGSF